VNSSPWADELETSGLVVLPQLLTATEISDLRREVHQILDERGMPMHGGTALPNAAAEAPTLASVFAHPGIVAAVHEATASERLVFTLEADLHRNVPAPHWHKDSGEQTVDGGYFDCDAPACPDCRVYKVAIYLQDHLDGTGLQVRPGSTRTAVLETGPPRAISTRAGDVVLFDVRLTHRGTRPPLPIRALAQVAEITRTSGARHAVARLRCSTNALRRRPDRIAIYVAYGLPNERTLTFARRNMARQTAQLGRPSPPLSADLIRLLASANVDVVAI